MAEIMDFCIMQSPLGELVLVADEQRLSGLYFADGYSEYEAFEATGRWRRTDQTPLLIETRRQLEAYFSGRLREFDLPLQLKTGTDFQKQVWLALAQIPYGRTMSYSDLAVLVGRPKACRAIGQANHRNPISIILPCHRVIGADGSLTGYGGGLERKRRLLELEAVGIGG